MYGTGSTRLFMRCLIDTYLKLILFVGWTIIYFALRLFGFSLDFGIMTSLDCIKSTVNTQDCLQYEKCARLGDKESDYVAVAYDKAKSLRPPYLHAAHVMLFSPSDDVLWNTFPRRGLVLMQMRFDGLLGFPGGLVEEGEPPVVGLNRELKEEIHFQVDKHCITDEDHLQSSVIEKKKLVLHFYTKKVSAEEFKELERNSIAAEEYGIEVCGNVRVPLYTMQDGVRGLPAFLANQFIGNSRNQLLMAVQHMGLLSTAEIKAALQSSTRHVAQAPENVQS